MCIFLFYYYYYTYFKNYENKILIEKQKKLGK